MLNFHVCRVFNDRVYDLQDPAGHIKCASLADIQLLKPAEFIVIVLPQY